METVLDVNKLLITIKVVPWNAEPHVCYGNCDCDQEYDRQKDLQETQGVEHEY